MPGSSQIPAFLFLSLLLLDTFAIIPTCHSPAALSSYSAAVVRGGRRN